MSGHSSVSPFAGCKADPPQAFVKLVAMLRGSGDSHLRHARGSESMLRSRFKSGLACYSLAAHTPLEKDRAWQVAWEVGDVYASAPALPEKASSMFHCCCQHVRVLNFGTTLVFSFCTRSQVLGGCVCLLLLFVRGLINSS